MNRILRRKFGPMGKGGIGGRRKLNNEEFHNLCSSPKIKEIKYIKWAGHVARMGAEK
jgi:hypothetical protein